MTEDKLTEDDLFPSGVLPNRKINTDEKLDDCISKILAKDLTEEDLANELLRLYGRVNAKISEIPSNAKICIDIIAQIRKAKHWDREDNPMNNIINFIMMVEKEALAVASKVPALQEIVVENK